MIVRGPRQERDFTILTNAALRDTRMTFKARGLLAFILSQRPGYEVSAVRLADAGPDGRSAVATGLQELEHAGYLVRRTERRPDGTFQPVSIVYESPVEADQPSAENLQSVPPAQTRETAGHTERRKSARGKPADNDVRTDVQGLCEGSTAVAVVIPEVEQLCDALAERVRQHRGDDTRPPITRTWRRDMGLLLRRGPLHTDTPQPMTVEAVSKCIEFVFTHLAVPDGKRGFCWADQVRSPAALRDHWHQLRQAAKALHHKHQGTSAATIDRVTERMKAGESRLGLFRETNHQGG